MNRVVFVIQSGVQFHEIISSQHGDAQIRNCDGIIYTVAGRIDISARVRVCVYMYVCATYALCMRVALHPAYRCKMIFRPKLTE